MSKRPVLITLIYWGVVGLMQFAPWFTCGFGAGHDEASNLIISDCHADARQGLTLFNTISILVYSFLAVSTIQSLRRTQNDHIMENES